jgi:hypothetical protein
MARTASLCGQSFHFIGRCEHNTSQEPGSAITFFFGLQPDSLIFDVKRRLEIIGRSSLSRPSCQG